MKRAPSGRVVSSNMRRMVAWSSLSSTENKEMKKLSTRRGSHPECRKRIRTCRLPEHGEGGGGFCVIDVTQTTWLPLHLGQCTFSHSVMHYMLFTFTGGPMLPP